MVLTCPNKECQLTFKQSAIAASNVKDLIINDCSISCPRCGTQTQFKSGKYNVDEKGNWNFLDNIPADHLKQIYRIAKNVYDDNKTQIEFLNSVALVSPAYSTQFKSLIALSENKNFRFWIKLLLTAIATFYGIENFNLDINIGNTTNNIEFVEKAEIKPINVNSNGIDNAKKSDVKKLKPTRRLKNRSKIK